MSEVDDANLLGFVSVSGVARVAPSVTRWRCLRLYGTDL